MSISIGSTLVQRHAALRRVTRSVLLLIILGLTPAVALASALEPQLTTNKGCRETGQDPVFAVGESIGLTFRIGSTSLSQASAAILDSTPDNRVTVISFGRVATNQTFAFSARIGGATGIETLVLRAESPGLATQRRTCSFTVVAGAPTATRTASRTRTPTRTPTPFGSATRTRTPSGDVSGTLSTNRGCREDGDVATYAIGESILVSFRLASDTQSRATASIVDTRANGLTTVFALGSIPTNVPLSFGGRVGAPNGVHTLRLRVGNATVDTCSFLVSGSAAPTATRSPSKTPTATRTRTASRTFTATPIPSACTGACSGGAMVSVNDLLTVIEIAAGRTPLSACPVADANGDLQVSLDEVLQAVNNALDGCPL